MIKITQCKEITFTARVTHYEEYADCDSFETYSFGELLWELDNMTSVDFLNRKQARMFRRLEKLTYLQYKDRADMNSNNCIIIEIPF